MRLLKPEEVGYLIASSRSTVDRAVASGVLASVTLHRGKKKRTYRVRGADVERIYGIALKEIEAFVRERDEGFEEKKAIRAKNGDLRNLDLALPRKASGKRSKFTSSLPVEKTDTASS